MTSGIPWTPSAGGEGWKGQGRVWNRDKPIRPDQATEEDRTCPQYFARSPMVLGLLDELADWEKGRLGNARRDIGSPHAVYLRILEGEHNLWESYWLTKK